MNASYFWASWLRGSYRNLLVKSAFVICTLTCAPSNIAMAAITAMEYIMGRRLQVCWYDERLQAWYLWVPWVVGILQKFVPSFALWPVYPPTYHCIYNIIAKACIMGRLLLVQWTPPSMVSLSFLGSGCLTNICSNCIHRLHFDLCTLQPSHGCYYYKNLPQLISSKTVKDMIDPLLEREFTMTTLSTEAEWRRACMLVSFLAQACMSEVAEVEKVMKLL